MVNDFESRHQAKAHTKAQKSARIGDKSDYRNLLVAFDSGHNRVLKIERINSSTPFFRPILDKKRRKTAFSISSQYIYPINDILYLVQIQTRLSSLSVDRNDQLASCFFTRVRPNVIKKFIQGWWSTREKLLMRLQNKWSINSKHCFSEPKNQTFFMAK